MQYEVLCYWCGQLVDSAGSYTDRHGDEQLVCASCVDAAEPAEVTA